MLSATIDYKWAVTDLSVGSQFAGYRIEGVAGRGGMGLVYRATDLSLDRVVALKLIGAELAANPGFRRRFETESKTAASLEHPNVIPIFGAGEHAGTLFLVMRYVEGEDLRSEIEADGRLPAERAVGIVAQVASALDAAHAAGLVHRDVKPANILIAPSGHAYLTDFGLTKRLITEADDTQTGHLLGTLNYVAPEQIRGATVDPRTDVYALGCVLYHALTGEVPFPIKEQEAKLWAHVSEPPPCPSAAPGVPAAFDEVVTRAMAKEPSERFQSAGDLAIAAAAAGTEAESPGVSQGAVSGRAERVSSGASVTVPESGRTQITRAQIGRALTSPFSLAILAATLIAGVAFDLFPAIVPVAVVGYAAAAAVTLRDHDFRRRVLEAQRRRRTEAGSPGDAGSDGQPSSRSAPTSRIAELLAQADDKAARIRDAIERADLPYAEVSQEVDRLLVTMRRTGARAELLHEGLEDMPPEAVSGRLERLRAENDPARAELIRALEEQVGVEREMELQLGRFYDRMEGMLVEFDTLRGHLITASASTEADEERHLAARLRDLREGVGVVADDMSAAYAERELVGETDQQ